MHIKLEQYENELSYIDWVCVWQAKLGKLALTWNMANNWKFNLFMIEQSLQSH